MNARRLPAQLGLQDRGEERRGEAGETQKESEDSQQHKEYQEDGVEKVCQVNGSLKNNWYMTCIPNFVLKTDSCLRCPLDLSLQHQLLEKNIDVFLAVMTVVNSESL